MSNPPVETVSTPRTGANSRLELRLLKIQWFRRTARLLLRQRLYIDARRVRHVNYTDGASIDKEEGRSRLFLVQADCWIVRLENQRHVRGRDGCGSWLDNHRQCHFFPIFYTRIFANKYKRRRRRKLTVPNWDSKISELVPRPCKHRNLMIMVDLWAPGLLKWRWFDCLLDDKY